MLEKLIRHLIRKYLYSWSFYKLLEIIWDEHGKVYYEDNFFTRLDHFESYLRVIASQGGRYRVREHGEHPVCPEVSSGEGSTGV
jgi:hypothetical protein